MGFHAHDENLITYRPLKYTIHSNRANREFKAIKQRSTQDLSNISRCEYTLQGFVNHLREDCFLTSNQSHIYRGDDAIGRHGITIHPGNQKGQCCGRTQNCFRKMFCRKIPVVRDANLFLAELADQGIRVANGAELVQDAFVDVQWWLGNTVSAHGAKISNGGCGYGVGPDVCRAVEVRVDVLQSEFSCIGAKTLLACHEECAFGCWEQVVVQVL